MEDILKKLDIILYQKNILKFLEILDEIHIHPQYEYIEVYFDSWKGFFHSKDGLIVSGAYSGKRECKTLIEGLNQLGTEGWKIVNCRTNLRNHHDTNAIYNFKEEEKYNYSKNIYEPSYEKENKYYQDNYKYYYEHSYILERKKAAFFNEILLELHSEPSKNLNKNPVFNKTREEEALEEYEQDTLFQELNLSARAYVCLKMANSASLESLEDLRYASKQEILEVVNMNQDVTE